MVAENERHHLIEFKDSIHAPDEEATKGIEFLQIFKNYLKVVALDGMMGL